MKNIDIYGTLGPSCANKATLTKMFHAGMNGIRLNLSHVNLSDCENWLLLFHEAAKAAQVKPKLLIDMKGPELRIGKLHEPLRLVEGETIRLGSEIAIPKEIYDHVPVNQQILLDDGKFLLKVKYVEDNDIVCTVVHGGLLTSSKSMALPNQQIALPTLTQSDIENLKNAVTYGVTGIMQPFVRNAQDLKCIQETLKQLHAEHLQVYAKIENRAGVEHLEELLPYCDCIVIARGDLGNAMPLSELPVVQKHIQDICHQHHKPYMVVTQMLNSMMEHPVPTRAEVSDIFYAVYHGADSIMLTGETAAGNYPVEAMTCFAQTAHSALQVLEEEKITK